MRPLTQRGIADKAATFTAGRLIAAVAQLGNIVLPLAISVVVLIANTSFKSCTSDVTSAQTGGLSLTMRSRLVARSIEQSHA